MNFHSEGIVLRRRNFGEADRVIIIFTKDFGKVSLLAKGVRKLTSRKRGHLEVFSRVKFSAHKGKALDIVTEVQTLDSFAPIRKSLKKVAVAYFLVEAVGRVTREEEKHAEVYTLLCQSLKNLENSQNLKSLRLDFTIELLTALGFWPRGKEMQNPDKVLEEVAERRISSVRVGKKLLV
jgi:DNA repair protein RecO (recombination protein O)